MGNGQILFFIMKMIIHWENGKEGGVMKVHELVTIGETMVSLASRVHIGLQYGPSLDMHIAGAESNTAIGLSKLGHSATFITRLGKDSLGQFILRMIRAEGVDTSYVKIDPEYPTGIMFKEALANNKTAVHYYRENSAATRLNISDIPKETITKAKIVHISGITPVLSQSCQQMVFDVMDLARSSGCAISFDPNIRKKLWGSHDYSPMMKELISKSSYVLIGLDEASMLYGTDDIKGLSDLIFSSANVEYLAIKNGSKGAWVLDNTRQFFIPPVPCNPIDSVGAGDGFNAGFLTGVLEDRPLEECGSIGAVVGALVTETKGDIEGLPNRQDVENVLENVKVDLR